VPFFSISGSDFVEMFVGVGASRVRDLFTQAKQASPCIIFVDEIHPSESARGDERYGRHLLDRQEGREGSRNLAASDRHRAAGALTRMPFPTEARDAGLRAWIGVLGERHPEIIWVPDKHKSADPDADGEIASAAVSGVPSPAR
jgi:hypothetical protein